MCSGCDVVEPWGAVIIGMFAGVGFGWQKSQNSSKNSQKISHYDGKMVEKIDSIDPKFG